MRSALAAVHITFALAVLFATGHQHEAQPRNLYPVWGLNRSEAIAANAPMARSLSANKTAVTAMWHLLDHFERIGGEMEAAVRGKSYVDNARRLVCNATNAVSLVAIDVKTRTLDFGKFSSSCITELDSMDHDGLWGALSAWRDGLQSIAANVLRITNDAVVAASGEPWTKAYTHAHFNYDGMLSTCQMFHIAAFRVNGKWALLGSLTSATPNLLTADRKRRYLEELMTRRDDGTIGNLIMRINATRNGVVKREPATTSMSAWGGIPAASIFLEVQPLDTNPAISAALLDGQRWSQQAADSQNAANISIMVLSLTLALVPIALFADVSRIVALTYALVTDIVSCLPLTIKGIELIGLSVIVHKSSRTWVYGLESTEALGVAETWVARCKPRARLFVLGAVFLAVSLISMVVGVSLEIYTRRRLKRVKNLNSYFELTSRNNVLKQLWASETRCPDCACYAARIDQIRDDTTMPLGSGGILTARHRRSVGVAGAERADARDVIQPRFP